ncbi:HNH endonuclease [Rhizobium leguminosarum]|uniref:HNH endonuclease n=1 Tax=Rhizobium leguminosarum TaxID=384 RepID=UPI0015DAF622|nr:HNH endonuclease [Rhizobium leguminosarum]NZD50570.1 HNH endonuclease [Rhizobium leguminosarum]
MAELTHERLLSLLRYDPVAGVFIWRVRVSNISAGTIAGTPKAKGYRGIRIDGISYYEHRLAVFYMTGEWPENDVDHRNLIRSDNRYANLRPATVSQNKMNRRAQSNNLLGVKGVSYDRRFDWYQARIKTNGRQRTIGVYGTLEEAAAAYEASANDNFGAFARAA